MLPVAATGPSALWYSTRGAGAATVVLLTLSVVLGIADNRHWRPAGWPRFVLDALHRNVSLLVLVVLAVHVGTAYLDSFAPIGLKDIVVPFVSSYRSIWLGLGALAFDLLLAVILTSLLRRHVGLHAWRLIHWLAYVSWPVAVVHGLGTGTDAKSGWMLVLTAVCVTAVLASALVRVMTGVPEASARRTAALAALIIGPMALVAWLPRGPLGSGWARRAGTPSALLPGAQIRLAAARSGGTLAVPFAGKLRGTLRQGRSPQGLVVVDLPMRFSGQTSGVIDIRLEGQPLPGGGIRMSRSQVTLGPASNPAAYRGSVQTLQGARVLATAADSGGTSLRLSVTLAVDQATRTVGGTISARRKGGPAR